MIDDGLSDIDENFLHTNPKISDSDGDKLSDENELRIGTDPLRKDTDGDGLEDGNELGMITDGKLDDWKRFGIEPILLDSKGDNAGGDAGTDIKAIYAVVDNKYLYVAFELFGRPDKNAGYIFPIDVNNDGNWDYSVGFNIDSVWFYDVRNVPNAVWPQNFEFLPDAEMSIEEIAEIKIPLSKIDNPNNITIYPWVNAFKPPKTVDEADYGRVSKSDKIVSTNPLNPDTDGDGLKDGVDPHPTIKESEVKTTTPPQTTAQTATPPLSPTQTPSPTSQPQQPRKTSIPILSIILAILLAYLRKKVKK